MQSTPKQQGNPVSVPSTPIPFGGNLAALLKRVGAKTETIVQPGRIEIRVGNPIAPIQPAQPIDPADAPPHPSLQRCTEPSDYWEPDYADFLFHRWDVCRSVKGVREVGPRGTGKTQAAQVYAARRGKWFLPVNVHGNMTADSLIGYSRLDLQGQGGDYFQPGPLTIAAQYDAVLLLDEFNRATPDVQAIVNALTDGVNNGFFNPYTMRFMRWDNPRIILTMNEGYSGCRNMDQALLDRFAPVKCDYLPPERESAIIIGRTGCSAPIVDTMVRCANSIRAANKGDGGTIPLDFDLSPRPLIECAERVVAGQSVDRAWLESVIWRAGMDTMLEPIIALSRSVGGYAV